MSPLTITRIRRSALVAAAFLLSTSATFGQIKWQNNVHTALKQAKATGKPMVIQFTAEWCHFCHKMDATTFADAAVRRQIASQFIPVKLDADENAELVSRLELKGLPATVVVDPSLRILKKLNGYQKVEKLTTELNDVVSSRRKVASVGYSRPSKSGLPAVRPGASSVRKVAEKRPVTKPVQRPTRTYAFDGLCLVSLRDERVLETGKPKFAVKYRSVNLAFGTEKQMQQFIDAPEKYWPKYNGVCQVSAAAGKKTSGRPEFGVMYRGEVWLFASAKHMQQFVDAPEKYTR